MLVHVLEIHLEPNINIRFCCVDVYQCARLDPQTATYYVAFLLWLTNINLGERSKKMLILLAHKFKDISGELC